MAKKKKKLPSSSAPTGKSKADALSTSHPARPIARPARLARKVKPVELLFDSGDFQRFLEAFFRHLTVPRILIAVCVSLIILVPTAFAFRGNDLKMVKADKLFAAQEWVAAEEIYAGLIDYLPLERDVALALAECRLEQGKTDGVFKILEIAAKNSKSVSREERNLFYARLNSLRAWYWFQKGNDVEGMKYARIGLKSNQRYPRTNYLVGDYYLRQGNLTAAGTYFSHLVNAEEYRAEYEAYLNAIEGAGSPVAE